MWITECVRYLSLGGDQVLETCQIAVIKGTASATFHVIYHHNTTTLHTAVAAVGRRLAGWGWKDDSFFQQGVEG